MSNEPVDPFTQGFMGTMKWIGAPVSLFLLCMTGWALSKGMWFAATLIGLAAVMYIVVTVRVWRGDYGV